MLECCGRYQARHKLYSGEPGMRLHADGGPGQGLEYAHRHIHHVSVKVREGDGIARDRHARKIRE